MLARLRPILPVLLGVGIAQLALGALNPLISLALVQRGAATPVIGLVLSCYFVGFLVGTQVCARIVDRVGHIRAFAVFAALAADAGLLHALVDAPWSWAILRGATGFVLSGVFLIAESWLNHKSTPETRGRTFGAYLVVTWSASALGPLTFNLGLSTAALFTLIGIGFATALLPMAMTLVGNPEIGERSRLGVKRLFAISPLGLVACFGAGLVNSAYYGLMPVYAERSGFAPSVLSVLLTTSLVGGLLAQYPVGWLSDRFGRRPVALATMLLALVTAIAILLFAQHSLPFLLSLVFVFAGMMAPLYGLGAGQTNDYVAPRDFVAASGGLLFAWALGSSVGPTAASAFMTVTGPGGLFVYVAIVLAAIAGFTVLRMRRRVGLPIDQQTAFVPAPAIPSNMPELDPRATRR
jgi:MFS family permease